MGNTPNISRERIEWCDIWIAGADKKGLPQALMIGDSITRGYFKNVDEKLKDKVDCARLATSKSLGDPLLLEELKLVLCQTEFDVVHFNNGLHGKGYTEEEYKAALPEALALIRQYAPNAKIIWANSTCVRDPEDMQKLGERIERIIERNRIACEFMAQEGIPVDDLFALVKDHPEYHCSDGCHFNEVGYGVLADQVSGFILDALKK